MANICIRIDDIDLGKIDFLIRKGRYKNRSQAIKSLLISKLRQEIIPFEWKDHFNGEERKKIIAELNKKASFTFSSSSIQPAEIVVEERRNRR